MRVFGQGRRPDDHGKPFDLSNTFGLRIDAFME
jgi:hypothetical protein